MITGYSFLSAEEEEEAEEEKVEVEEEEEVVEEEKEEEVEGKKMLMRKVCKTKTSFETLIMLHDFHPYKHIVEELISLKGGTLVQAFSCLCPFHI